MRFLCDEMLVRLARLLRAAGYDTYLAAGGQPDAALLEIARAEDRLLLTRDKRLAAEAAPGSRLVHGRGAVDEARHLAAEVAIDWNHAPFTRCVIDNTPLRAATPAEVAAMPLAARRLPGPFRACPACGRRYWPGSHVRRMGARLADLAQLPPQP